MGALAPPGRIKKFRRNSRGKLVSAPPAHQVHPRRSKSQFLGHFLMCQEDFELELVVLDPLLEATTKKIKKGRQLFQEKKCTVF